MKAKTFDGEFDKGSDIIDMLDITKAKRSMQDQRQENFSDTGRGAGEAKAGEQLTLEILIISIIVQRFE